MIQFDYITLNSQLFPMESFQYGIFPKFPCLTSHGNLPEMCRLFATLNNNNNKTTCYLYSAFPGAQSALQVSKENNV